MPGPGWFPLWSYDEMWLQFHGHFIHGNAHVLSAQATVLNVSVSVDKVTMKLEAPDVRLDRLNRSLLTSQERSVFDAAIAIMASSGKSQLNFFGLRATATGRETTCYVDAFPVFMSGTV